MDGEISSPSSPDDTNSTAAELRVNAATWAVLGDSPQVNSFVDKMMIMDMKDLVLQPKIAGGVGFRIELDEHHTHAYVQLTGLKPNHNFEIDGHSVTCAQLTTLLTQYTFMNHEKMQHYMLDMNGPMTDDNHLMIMFMSDAEGRARMTMRLPTLLRTKGVSPKTDGDMPLLSVVVHENSMMSTPVMQRHVPLACTDDLTFRVTAD
jgi:hypothetical protein